MVAAIAMTCVLALGVLGATQPAGGRLVFEAGRTGKLRSQLLISTSVAIDALRP